MAMLALLSDSALIGCSSVWNGILEEVLPGMGCRGLRLQGLTTRGRREIVATTLVVLFPELDQGTTWERLCVFPADSL